MSDFERFAFACENISKMVGSKLKKEFIYAIKYDCGIDACDSVLHGRENQKKLWRMINGGEKAELFVESSSVELSPVIDGSQPQKLNSLLLRGDLPLYIDELAELLEERVVIDLSGLSYQRPDEYHCNLTYKKLLGGFQCGDGEFCALLAFVICRAMMKRKICLYLIADENMEAAEKMLSLFESRGLLAEMHLCFRPTALAVKKAAELCLNAPKKNISPEIIISEENYAFENIRELFAELPASRISFCSFLSNEKGKQEFEIAFKTIFQEK